MAVTVIITLLLPVLAVAAYEMEGDVYVLTSDNFRAFVSEHPVSLVQFHTPWCGKCRDFADDWAKLASKAKALERPVSLAKIDAKEYKDIADEYNVYGFPNIHLFHEGGGEEYEGHRDFDKLLGLLTSVSQYRPPVELSTAAELQSLATAADHSVVLGLFRQPIAASAAFKTFKRALWELARSGHPLTAAWSASYSKPPVMPRTSAGKEPPVPGLVQVGRSGSTAVSAMRLPRKKEDFTKEAIAEWLGARLADKPNDYPEKDYTDPDDPEPEQEGEGYRGEHEGYGEGYPHDD